jgi:hypothetical protein
MHLVYPETPAEDRGDDGMPTIAPDLRRYPFAGYHKLQCYTIKLHSSPTQPAAHCPLRSQRQRRDILCKDTTLGAEISGEKRAREGLRPFMPLA